MWKDHIVQTPDTCFGKPRVRGTRMRVDFLLRRLAQGMAVDDICVEYPHLTPDKVRAAIAYAADRIDDI